LFYYNNENNEILLGKNRSINKLSDFHQKRKNEKTKKQKKKKKNPQKILNPFAPPGGH
jgi:hypothetical protein